MLDYTKTYTLSTTILILLAVIGHHLPGIHIAGLNLFLFIIYLLVVKVVLTIFLFIIYSTRISISRIDIYLLLFLTYIIISAQWATNIDMALTSIGIVASSIMITILISTTVVNNSDLHYYVRILKFFTIFILVLAVLDAIFGANVTSLQWFDQDLYSTGWYTNRNNLSYFLTMVSPFFLINFFNPKFGIRKRLLELTAYISCLSIIYLNGTRAALFAQSIIILLAISFVLYSRVDRVQESRIFNIRKPFLPTMLISIPFLMILFMTIQNPFTLDSNVSLTIRWNLHLGGFILFVENIFGVGIGNFAYEYAKLGLEPGSIRPHSWIAGIIGELGIFGIVTFIFAYGTMLDHLYNNVINKCDYFDLALFISVFSFSFAGLSPSNVLELQIHWIIFGIALAKIKLSTQNQIVTNNDI